MKKKTLIAIAACIASMTFFACSPKDVTLQTPVKDEHTGKWGYANAKAAGSSTADARGKMTASSVKQTE